jgi:hypothetical protein
MKQEATLIRARLKTPRAAAIAGIAFLWFIGVLRDRLRRVNSLRNNIGEDRVLGHFGGGLEYRFTPHIGLFGEAGYDLVNGASNNFIQTNFGLRYAF